MYLQQPLQELPMNYAIQSSLNIRYELMKDAKHICMPTPYQNTSNNFVLKTKKEFSLGSRRYITVPTGIRILDFPELPVTSNNMPIDMYIEGTCLSLPDIESEYGVRVTGPSILSKTYNDEIKVTLFNNSNTIFDCDEGDEIAILAFVLKPVINFNIDIATQNIPKELR